MPKELAEFDTLEVNVSKKGGRKVDWGKIGEKIIELAQAYSAREVWERMDLVNKRVTLFRTKSALDKLCKDTKDRKAVLQSRWDGKRFWYARKGGRRT